MLEHKNALVKNHIIKIDSSQGLYLDEQFFNWKTGKQERATSITPSLVTNQAPYSFSIGWITMSFTVEYLADLRRTVDLVVDSLGRHLSDEVVDISSTYRGYREAIRFSCGAVVAFSRIRNDFILVLEQSVCERIEILYLMLLIKDFVDFGGWITRLDLTVDDYTHSLNLSQIFEAYQAGSMVARTKVLKYDNGYKSPGVKDLEMIRIGKRSSQFFSRIYNKFLESKGKIDAIRFEVELKQELAHHSFLALFLRSLPSEQSYSKSNSKELDLGEFAKTVLGIISAKLDFVDRASNSNISRCSRLWWWQQFLDGIEEIKIVIPRVKSTIKSIESWVLRSVVASLALLVANQGDNSEVYLGDLISLGFAKLKDRHRAILIDAQKLASVPVVNYYDKILTL